MLLVLGLAACSTKPAQPSAAATVALPNPLAPLPPRAEVLAVVQRLESDGALEATSDRAQRWVYAGRLLERSWRRERQLDDQTRALAAFAKAAELPSPFACDALLAQALLQAEVQRDPTLAYTAAHLLRFRKERLQAPFGNDCLNRAERVLFSLQAFKPFPAVLLEIERRAEVEPRASTTLAPASSTNPKLMASSAAASASASTALLPPDAAPPLSSASEATSAGVAPAPLGAGGPVRITRVERYGSADAARVVIHTTRPPNYRVGELGPSTTAPGYRLFIDLDQASYSGVREFELGGIVERLRVGTHSDATRVVLDLAAAAHHRVFYLPEPFRLVVDIAREPLPVAVEQAPGPRSVRRVVLDPGHGGHDPGAIGPTGLREKDVTLDVTHRAAPLIARELGIATLLTRDDDVFVALDERTARANAFRADLFISIHCNASEDGQAQGTMTFVLDDSPDTLASHIAARENAASPAAAAELATVMGGSLDRHSLQQSAHFAELLQRASVASLGPHYTGVADLGVRRAGFYVLAGAQMPAALFEISFISNSAGEAGLNTADYRQRVADAVVNAVRAYRDGY